MRSCTGLPCPQRTSGSTPNRSPDISRRPAAPPCRQLAEHRLEETDRGFERRAVALVEHGDEPLQRRDAELAATLEQAQASRRGAHAHDACVVAVTLAPGEAGSLHLRHPRALSGRADLLPWPPTPRPAGAPPPGG